MIMQDLTPSPHVVRGLALARCARTPCCLVRLACLRVALVEREVPRHECDSVAVLGRELGERHLHTRGAGAVLARDEGYRRRCWSYGEGASRANVASAPSIPHSP